MVAPSLSRLVIPDEWRGIIAQVDAMFPGAVLCGGALRDLVWGKQDAVKDLDFVVGQPYRSIHDNQTGQLPSWFLTDVFNGNYFGFRQDVICVERFDIAGSFPNVELIYLDAPMRTLAERVIRRNDFGCCQVAYDRQGFSASAHFYHDVTHNKFTLVNCEDVTQADRSLRRAARWRDKYPGIEFDVTAAIDRYAEQTDIERGRV
jgi:hypothetical protein